MVGRENSVFGKHLVIRYGQDNNDECLGIRFEMMFMRIGVLGRPWE